MLGSDRSFPNGIVLLAGPAGSGKTMYCRQFIYDGIANNDYCIYVTSIMNEELARKFFSAIPSDTETKLKIINPLQ
jgi:KaiC/GvpD/RAD55 family RecA-like ATPase